MYHHRLGSAFSALYLYCMLVYVVMHDAPIRDIFFVFCVLD